MKKSQRSALRRLAVTTLVTIACAGAAVTAQAAYIVNATEVGGDVVFEGTGSFDLTAWSYTLDIERGTTAQFGTGGLFLGSGVYTGHYNTPTDWTGPSTIPVSSPGAATTSTGPLHGLIWSGPRLFVTTGYVSEQSIAGSAIFAGQTFATLDLTPGTYEWTWGSGASFDSFTLNVSAVPVPAAVWLFGSGLLGLVGVARRKARA
jgi:hypothetical protein